MTKFELTEGFLTDSYEWGTMLKPLADIALVVVLPSKYGAEYFVNTHPQKIINDFKKFLEGFFPGKFAKAKNRSVNIKLDNAYGFDVIPVFARKGGGYFVPDMEKGKWGYLEFKKYGELIANANRSSGNKLITMIKMLKCWNKNNGNVFDSFHLEILAVKIFDGPIESYPLAMLAFSSKAEKLVGVSCYDPAIPERQIDEYLQSAQRLQIKGALISAAQNAQKAINLEATNYVKEANVIWKLLFGLAFPA